jgi:putative hydrolase of the HAD superfamily
MTNIKAVLFDYGMVLSGPPDPTARQDMMRILGVNEEAFQQIYWKHRDAYDRGVLSGIAYWQQVAADLDHPLDAPQLNALIQADTDLWGRPNIDMTAWAQHLHRAGIATGILSNIGDAMEAGILARYPWLANFAHSTFSHRLGIAKPDPAIYNHAAKGLGFPTTEILFIDDREENIAAARRVGMIAIQYATHDAFVAEMQRLSLQSLLNPKLGPTS